MISSKSLFIFSTVFLGLSWSVADVFGNSNGVNEDGALENSLLLKNFIDEIEKSSFGVRMSKSANASARNSGKSVDRRWCHISSLPRNHNAPVLKGNLFDLKRTPEGQILATVRSEDLAKRKEQLHKALGLLDQNWDVRKLKALYYCADTTLYTPRIFIVNVWGQALQATRATEAFKDEETGKPPFQAPGWLCYYEGKFSVPEDGEYRFVGMGDDAMIVGVARRTVLCAFWPGEGHGLPVRYKKGWEPQYCCGKDGTDGRNLANRGQRSSLYKGHWQKLKKGQKYTIQVAVGEAAGGLAGACLGIQQKGKDTDDNFPLFTLEPMEAVPEWNIGDTGRYNTSRCFQAR